MYGSRHRFSIRSNHKILPDRNRFQHARFSPTISSVAQLPSSLRTFDDPLRSLSGAHTRVATRMLEAPRPIRLWHLISLDAPTVALVWSLSFAWIARVQLPAWVPALLVLAVWAVYVADRLLDARTAIGSGTLSSLRERHLFHWRHRRVLLPLAILAAGAAGVLIIDLMPTAAKERNSLLAAASLVYFTRVHSRRRLPFPKELLVGLLFTAGCVIPSWSRTTLPGTALLGALFVPACFYALLAWLNCHAIDRWESGVQSRSPVIFTALLVALIGIAAAALLMHSHPRSAALVAVGIAAAMLVAMLDGVRGRLTPVALRAAADLALLTPIFLLPCARLFP
jgi:hypothetical protein